MVTKNKPCIDEKVKTIDKDANLATSIFEESSEVKEYAQSQLTFESIADSPTNPPPPKPESLHETVHKAGWLGEQIMAILRYLGNRFPNFYVFFTVLERLVMLLSQGWAKISQRFSEVRLKRVRKRTNDNSSFNNNATLSFMDVMVTDLRRTLTFFLSLVVAGAAIGLASIVLVVVLIWPQLPTLEQISKYDPVLPMQIFTIDGKKIGEFGTEHRTFTAYENIPKHLVNALVAAEDQRFFSHSGFDPIGLARAVMVGLTTGRARGTSTITQQLARNFFLTQEKTIWRKLIELLLAVKIEQSLSKEKILEVYMNQIYLGQRSYGFTSAAKAYFAKELDELTISESAIMAGLPKFPSVNPHTRPKRVLQRRAYTLGRMLDDGYITQEEYDIASKEPIKKKSVVKKAVMIESNHVAEMARQYVMDLLKIQGIEKPEELAYAKGFKVITSIRSDWQDKAESALQSGIIRFELEHGFRAPETQVNIQTELSGKEAIIAWENHFVGLESDKTLKPAILIARNKSKLEFYVQGGERFTVNAAKISKLKKFLKHPVGHKNALHVGAIVRVFAAPATKSKNKSVAKKKQWRITQLPKVEGGFVAVNPNDGRVEALVGSYSYTHNKFNHVTQAWRQPGSTFKPFIYSAAIDTGVAAGDLYDDQALEFIMPNGEIWEPKNYSGKYEGPMTIRKALASSSNTIVLQVLNNIGVDYAHQYISRFGFDPNKIPEVLSMALGSGEVTVMQMATGYSHFANGGYRIQPWIISEVRDASGTLYFKHKPQKEKAIENLVLDSRNVYIMDSLLKQVVINGTAAKARRALKRSDIAGKTGTTNDYVDAWFCGYHPDLVGVVWMGYDIPKRLGRGASGGRLALPIWIDFMKTALKTLPIKIKKKPVGIAEYNNDFILQEFKEEKLQSLQPWDVWGNEGEPEWEEAEPDFNPDESTVFAPDSFIEPESEPAPTTPFF